MSFAEARAAAPRAAWSETLSRYTKKPIELRGAKALRLEGLDFDVGLKPLAYDGYQLDVAHAEEGARTSASRCAAALAILIKVTEARFGPMGPIAPLSDGETGGLPIGFLAGDNSTKGEPIVLGQASRVQVFQPEETATTLWLTGQRRKGFSAVIGGRYLGPGSALWPSTCVVTARLTALPSRPDVEWLDLARLPSRPVPTLGARRRSFAGLESLPSAAADVEITCDLHRAFGRVSGCKAAGGVPASLAQPAERQGNELRLEPSLLDPDRDIPLRLRLTVRVDPADAKPFVLPPGVTPLKASEVTWTAQPTKEDMTRLYPDRATRMGIGANIRLLCRLEADGALTCPEVKVATVAGEEGAFDGWGDQVSALYRAAPTLADGSPSAGRWVALGFRLSLP